MLLSFCLPKAKLVEQHLKGTSDFYQGSRNSNSLTSVLLAPSAVSSESPCVSYSTGLSIDPSLSVGSLGFCRASAGSSQLDREAMKSAGLRWSKASQSTW